MGEEGEVEGAEPFKFFHPFHAFTPSPFVPFSPMPFSPSFPSFPSPPPPPEPKPTALAKLNGALSGSSTPRAWRLALAGALGGKRLKGGERGRRVSERAVWWVADSSELVLGVGVGALVRWCVGWVVCVDFDMRSFVMLCEREGRGR